MIRCTLPLMMIFALLAAGSLSVLAQDRPHGNGRPDAREPERDHDAREDRADRAGPGPQRGVDRPPPPPLTSRQLDEAMAVIRDISPWFVERLEQDREEDPERFRERVARMYPRLTMFLELKHRDEKLYELRVSEARLDSRSRWLSARLRREMSRPESDAQEIEQNRQELRTVLAELFDVRQQARQHEIDTLKRRLAELEAELSKHRQQREQLIERRYEDMLHPPERRGREPRSRDGEPDEPADGD